MTSAGNAPGRPRIVHTIEVSADAEAVWEALTDPSLTRRYLFGLGVRSDWSAGARVVFEQADRTPYFDGEILEIHRARRLSLSVRVVADAETSADLPSRITWEIEPLETGCRVTVIHDEFEGETATCRRVRSGWPMAVAGLAHLLETGEVPLQSDWPARVRERLAGWPGAGR